MKYKVGDKIVIKSSSPHYKSCKGTITYISRGAGFIIDDDDVYLLQDEKTKWKFVQIQLENK